MEFQVSDFTEFSDHAPIIATFRRSPYQIPSCERCATDCNQTTEQRVRWDPDRKDTIRRSLVDYMPDLRNVSVLFSANDSDIDASLNDFVSIIDKTFSPFCKHNVKYGCPCDCHHVKTELPCKAWFCAKCKTLYQKYMSYLSKFNLCRSNENRALLVESKRKYKVFVAKQKRNYLRYQGNHLEYIKRCNPKLFYKNFSKSKSKPNTNLTKDDFYTHFRDLAGVGQTDDNSSESEDTTDKPCTYPELDEEFTEEEIMEAIKSSKCNKSPGRDGLLYEYFKEYADIFVPILVCLFNCLLKRGYYPDIWARGILLPLHKKGDANDPNNYRGITLLSHVSKLFTSCINKRILRLNKTENLITDAQFGFKSGVGTCDAVFNLQCLITGACGALQAPWSYITKRKATLQVRIDEDPLSKPYLYHLSYLSNAINHDELSH